MIYQDQANHLSDLLKDRLGVRGQDLETRLHRAGRLLPRHIRRDMDAVVHSVQFQASPKLARMVDDGAAHRAYDNCVAYLNSIDPSKRRLDRLIGIASTIVFNVLIVGALFLTVLAWRGLL